MATEIGEPLSEEKEEVGEGDEKLNYVSPGCLITQNPGFIKGHGTLLVDDVRLHATVAGHVERINRLVTVRPFKNARYHGEVGDVVVGRISEVAQKKWKVDVYAKLVSI